MKKEEISKAEIFCIFIVVLLFSAGCSADITTKEIEKKIIEINSDLKVYSFNFNTTFTLYKQTENMRNAEVGRTETNLKGEVDRQNKKMYLKISLNTDSWSLSSFNGDEYEFYITEDYRYDIVDESYPSYPSSTATGSKKALKSKTRQHEWNQLDKTAQIVESIKSGSVERLKDESFNGKSYYVLQITPDSDIMIKQFLSALQIAPITYDEDNEEMKKNIDTAEVMNSYKQLLWVNKKTFVIEKSKTNSNGGYLRIEQKLNPEGMKIKTYITVNIELINSNINKESDITLPDSGQSVVELNEFEPKKFLPERCSFPVGLVCGEHKIGTSDIKFAVTNLLGDEISVKSVRFTTEDGIELNCPDTEDLKSEWSKEIWDNEEKKYFVFTNCNSKDVGIEAGNKEEINVKLTYEIVRNGSIRVANAKISDSVEQ